MQKKLCSECGEIAEVSLCQIVSSVGRATRQQRCSISTLLLRGRVYRAESSSSERLGLRGIHKPLSEAFTALAERL